jgi:hypothetical protein
MISDALLVEIADKIGGLDQWRFQCHAASLAVIQTGLLPEGARVARGGCPGVPSQHSWVVLGGNCYDSEAVVLDPTLWSYTRAQPYIYRGKAKARPHLPHGSGSIWQFGRPDDPSGPVIALGKRLSENAETFLKLAAPKGLDLNGWRVLANSPIGGWPAAEIIDAMADNPHLVAVIPVDILGMVTDRNPKNLYW